MRIGIPLVTCVLALAAGAMLFYAYSPKEAPLDTALPAADAASTSPTSVEELPASPDARPRIVIGGRTVAVALADTPEERTRGLGGRADLPDGEGMLFIFPEEGTYGFWMKDMRFSIDIIWLSADLQVVHIAENVAPESYPASFEPGKAAQYVLEVPAGFARSHNIATGSLATLLR